MTTDTALPRATHRARFRRKTGNMFTNLDFFDAGGRLKHTLIFDNYARLGDPPRPYNIRLYGLDGVFTETWQPPPGGALDGWFACARAADDGAIPAFLDWLLEHAPAGELRDALDALVTRGVEPHPGVVEYE